MNSWHSRIVNERHQQQVNYEHLTRSRMPTTITFTKWQQQVQQVALLQVQSKSIAHFPIGTINWTITWKNYEETNGQWNFVWKSKFEMFNGNKKMWFFFVDIIFLIKNSNKTWNAIWKSKGKWKFIDLNCVEVRSKSPYKPIGRNQRSYHS